MAKKRKRPSWQRSLIKLAGGKKALIEKLATAAVVLLVTGALASAALPKPKSPAPAPANQPAEQPAQEAGEEAPSEPAPGAAASPAERPSCPSAAAMYVITPRGLNLREERSLNARVLARMPNGAPVRAGCRSGEWLTVTYNFQTGYALAQFLSGTAPSSGGGTQASFKVTDVSISVTPTDTVINCEQDYVFTGTIKADGPGTVNYRWDRSDGSNVPGSIVFTAAGTRSVSDTWTVTATTNGWARLSIIAPNSMVSNDAPVDFIDSPVCL